MRSFRKHILLLFPFRTIYFLYNPFYPHCLPSPSYLPSSFCLSPLPLFPSTFPPLSRLVLPFSFLLAFLFTLSTFSPFFQSRFRFLPSSINLPTYQFFTYLCISSSTFFYFSLPIFPNPFAPFSLFLTTVQQPIIISNVENCRQKALY